MEDPYADPELIQDEAAELDQDPIPGLGDPPDDDDEGDE